MTENQRQSEVLPGHTPGPWRTNDHTKDDDCIYIEADGGGICTIFVNYDKHERSNARLIAAAPALLAALKEIDAHHAEKNTSAGRPHERSKTLTIARAAIALAERGAEQ